MSTWLKTFLQQSSGGGSAAAFAAAAGLAVVAPATAQSGDNYEWEPGVGYHEEEWYDPTDWFDDDYDHGDQIDYEETWRIDYNDDDYYADWDYYLDEDDPADYDYWDSPYDYDAGYDDGADWDYYSDEDDPADYDYWDSPYDFDYRTAADRPLQRFELHGELDAWQRRDLEGQRNAHTLVRLRMEDGASAVVNLGPNVELDRLRLDGGDMVAVRGVRGSIDGQAVLMAQAVHVDDRTVRMTNWSVGRLAANESRRQGDRTEHDGAAETGRENQADQDRRRRQIVRRVIRGWPDASREAVRDMMDRHGMPDAVSAERITWMDTPPFVKTVVYNHAVDHNFPVPHQDVLEQYVNYRVPADKMDDLARFDGSVIVFRTDGLMAARCDKQPMNILALNLAQDVAEGDRTWREARRKYAETARAYMDGERPRITQRLEIDSSPTNREHPDRPGSRYRSDRAERDPATD